jgi:hypothetical protein
MTTDDQLEQTIQRVWHEWFPTRALPIIEINQCAGHRYITINIGYASLTSLVPTPLEPEIAETVAETVLGYLENCFISRLN